MRPSWEKYLTDTGQRIPVQNCSVAEFLIGCTQSTEICGDEFPARVTMAKNSTIFFFFSKAGWGEKSMKVKICLGRASEIGGVDSPSKMRTGTLDGVSMLKARFSGWGLEDTGRFFEYSHSAKPFGRTSTLNRAGQVDGSNAVIVFSGYACDYCKGRIRQE